MNLLATLAFLLTFLVLLVAVFVILVSLVRGRPATAGKFGLGMLAWIAGYAAILLAVSLNSPQPVLGPGQEHCFDEMCYSVQGTTLAQTLGSRRASGTFYIVTVALRNAARGTPQKPSNPELWIVDARGRRYTQAFSAGELAGQPIDPHHLWDRKLQVGERIDRAVAFDLPADATQPRLVITEGSGFPTDVIIGDENSFLHPKTEFQLVANTVDGG